MKYAEPQEQVAAGQRAVPVALLPCTSYDASKIDLCVGTALDAAGPEVHRGMIVLVKPNLLCPRPLACASAQVVKAACAWLLDKGVRVRVADSPGFGRAAVVARKIGLEEALKGTGLAVEALGSPQPVDLPLPAPCGGRTARFMVARLAVEADVILSVPRVKAHSQMLLTLAVKNCFGCVSGLHKALIHTREGRDPAYFADCLAALWAALPPVAALADGIEAMHVTGPSRGEPFALHLVGASPSAVALDEALYAVLGLAPLHVPLGAALMRRQADGCAAAGWQAVYTHARPEAFDARGFALPRELLHTSFHLARLLQSCIRRIWAACKK